MKMHLFLYSCIGMSLLIVAKSKEKSNGYFDIIDNPLVMKNFDDYNDEIEDNNNNNGITDEIDEDNNNNDEITDKRVDDDNNDGISDKIDKDNNNKDEITDEIDNDNDNDDITAETDDDTNNDGITDEIDEDNYNNNDITEEIDGDNYNNDERRNGNDASKCHESDTNECGQPNNFEQIKNFKSPEAVKLTDENLEEKNILIEDFKKPHKEKKRIKRGVNPIDGPISLKELKQVKINVPFKMGERDLYVTEYHHATLESEDRENRWKIPTCVTNLKELYTCIFCTKDVTVKENFRSCYGLLPKRVREQGVKCMNEVLELPFGEGSNNIDYYHYLCVKFKSVRKIIQCTELNLPELPHDEFMEEENALALYTYCIYSINRRHCC